MQLELVTDGSGEEQEGVTDGHAAPVHKRTGLQRSKPNKHKVRFVAAEADLEIF